VYTRQQMSISSNY